MREVTIIFNNNMYEITGKNIFDYPTLSSMSYACWLDYIDELKKKEKFSIEIPDVEKDRFIRRSIFGGRVAAYRKSFINKKYENLLNQTLSKHHLTRSEYFACPESLKKSIDAEIVQNMTYEEVMQSRDFLFNGDVSSLYPCAMAGNEFLKVQFPTGFSRWTENCEMAFNSGKIGFYEIEYIPVKNIDKPILPRRLKDGSIKWDLMDGTGVYNSVDIKNALKVGYQIKFINRCLVYDESRDDIFTGYIQKFYNMKAEEDKKANPNEAKRNICKLKMNGLYGKMLQKPIFEHEMIATNIKEVYAFLKDKEFLKLDILDENKVLIKAKSLETSEDDCVNKPSQFGSFVLGYSRELMQHYFEQYDNTLTKHTMTYGDTDSSHIYGDIYYEMKQKGFIPDEPKLGYLSNDIKDKNGMIIMELCIGAKMYLYKYITSDGRIVTKMKAKGLPKKCLTQQFFMEETGKVTIENSFTKVFNKQTQKEKEQNIGMFSIYKKDISRTFNAVQWSGRELHDDGFYYPIGFIGEKYDQ